jgi:CDP-4-dehydro-6-deoxyglucose reductase, E3
MSGPLVTRFAHRRPIAEDVVDIGFQLVDPGKIAFRGGQFVTLSVGHDPEGRPVRRSYSIASPSDDGDLLRFLIKLNTGGPAASFFDQLQVGSPVDMTGPHGFFTLDAGHPGDVVFAATGTGLAPVLPMLGELARTAPTGQRLLYWGLRKESDLFLLDELRALCASAGCELMTFLSQPSPEWRGLRGRITDPILEALPRLNAPTFYLVGNGAMIKELKSRLMEAGVDRKKQIRTEAFFD